MAKQVKLVRIVSEGLEFAPLGLLIAEWMAPLACRLAGWRKAAAVALSPGRRGD